MRKTLLGKEIKATALAMALMGAVIGTATTFANGCGKADEIFDCQSVCERYRDCYKSDYDVDGCRQRCRENSDQSASVRQDADECEACIGDKSCLSATFNCAGSCGTIVP